MVSHIIRPIIYIVYVCKTSWDVMEVGQVLSLPVGCQLIGLAQSASEKLRVTTLDFARLCIPPGHATRRSVFPRE